MSPKIEQCTLNLTFEESDEFLLEVVGKKYVLLHRLDCHLPITRYLFSEVYLSGNYIGMVHPPSGSHQVSIENLVQTKLWTKYHITTNQILRPRVIMPLTKLALTSR